jgi:sulfate adenylyltransferase
VSEPDASLLPVTEQPRAVVPVWHPPRAVLEIFELVLIGALPPLSEVYALVGVPGLSELADAADAAGSGSAHPAPPPAARPLLVEDAEGTPVVRIEAGDRLVAVRPFTAPPLRARRRPPRDLVSGDAGAGRALTVVVPGLPTAADVDAAVADAVAQGRPVRWLVLVGTGRGPLSAEGAWRAVRGLARPGDDVVPVAVPYLAVDPLVAPVARRYAGPGGQARVLPVAAVGAGGGPGTGRALPACFVRELELRGCPPARRGVTVFFTGLSGSGKSTIAKALAARLLEDGRRTVTMLDGDEVRRLLSHGLGFTRADRDLNIRRIGFVAAEVTRHGGVAVCAPIAPFEQVRAQVRAAVEEVGDLVLVYVATPLEECERRDRKGLYARARRGEIPDFTGISSPYEVPTDADLVLDTTGRSVEECLDDVWALLEQRGYLG